MTVPVPFFETVKVLGPSQTEPLQTVPVEQEAVASSDSNKVFPSLAEKVIVP